MYRTGKNRRNSNRNNGNNKRKKKSYKKRTYKKNINGIINGGAGVGAGVVDAAGEVFNFAKDAYKSTYVAMPLAIYDTQRATKSLVRNINEVYKFYLYCKTINKSTIGCPDLLRRFTYALRQLGKNIKLIIESGLVAKIIKIVESKLTQSEFVKEFNEMNKIITELSRESDLATPSTFINRASNTIMVGAYADWYRYELYIYANNLHMIVSEIMSVKISGICVSETDILHESGAVVRQSEISDTVLPEHQTLRRRRVVAVAHGSSSSSSDTLKEQSAKDA